MGDVVGSSPDVGPGIACPSQTDSSVPILALASDSSVVVGRVADAESAVWVQFAASLVKLALFTPIAW